MKFLNENQKLKITVTQGKLIAGMMLGRCKCKRGQHYVCITVKFRDQKKK